MIVKMQPAMYKSLTDMVDDDAMMDLSQYFRLGKKYIICSLNRDTDLPGGLGPRLEGSK